MVWWSVLACTGMPVCSDDPTGPVEALEHVQRARADLASAGVDLCVSELAYGPTPSLQNGRLVVRVDHVRADVFEAGCHALVEREGLPEGARALSTSGLRPGGDVDEDRASAFARACGREAERQEGAVLAALSQCGPVELDTHQQLVIDTLGMAPLLRSRETSWAEVVRLPTNGLAGEPAFTDDRMANAFSSWSGEASRVGVWSLANGQLQWVEQLDEQPNFGLPASAGDELLIVDDFHGRVWRLEPDGAVELAPIPDNATVHRDGDRWVALTDAFRGGALFSYDPLDGVGPLLMGGTLGMLPDPDGLWVFTDEEWRRLDGTVLPAPMSTLALGRLAVHDGRVWSVYHGADGLAVVSRSRDVSEPWRLERTLCTSDYGELKTSDNGLFLRRYTFNEAVSASEMVVDRLISGGAASDE